MKINKIMEKEIDVAVSFKEVNKIKVKLQLVETPHII